VIPDDGLVKIKIQDEGRGIPPDEIEDIFKPYFRSKNEADLKVKGTGLGLAIVKHIIDAHKGKILVESKPGMGSTFSLIFELISDEENINSIGFASDGMCRHPRECEAR
jgi:two-component system phosphate regulon sensor histidine kinase PhoR